MKVKYEITMEVEVEVDSETELSSTIITDFAGKAKIGFVNCGYVLPDARVTKVEVSRKGTTGIVPKVIKKGYGDFLCRSLTEK